MKAHDLLEKIATLMLGKHSSPADDFAQENRSKAPSRTFEKLEN
jgi:hypothetical protein